MKSLIILVVLTAIVAINMNQIANIVEKKLTNHVLVQTSQSMIGKKVQ